MKPHVHLSMVHGLAVLLLVFAVFGTLHVLAMSKPDHPLSRAWITGAGF